MKRQEPRVTFDCPVCGAEVLVGSPGCRECGSTAETGWSPDTEYDGLDLPEPPGSSVDEEEDHAQPRIARWAMALIILATAATLLVSMW